MKSPVLSMYFLPSLNVLILNRLPNNPHSALAMLAHLPFQKYAKSFPSLGSQCSLCPFLRLSSIVYHSGLSLNIISKGYFQTTLFKITTQPFTVGPLYSIFLFDPYQSDITFVLFVDMSFIYFFSCLVSTWAPWK